MLFDEDFLAATKNSKKMSFSKIQLFGIRIQRPCLGLSQTLIGTSGKAKISIKEPRKLTLPAAALALKNHVACEA